ncbi:MAG: heme-binding domain-containing protein [Candidatus Latescibacterota bacterium]|nr:MAG: heme-binding domain-containing protein [Candidatus Latescibacterota bacterium]
MSEPRARRWPRVLLLAFLLVAALLQLVPVERGNPAVQTDVAAPSDVDVVLRRACYDCHSNETRWPWYGYVAPVSWLLARHVKKGRADLNFSEWPALDFELQSLALRDIEEQIVQEKMPLGSYTRLHRDATLTRSGRDLLLEWARSQR